MFYLGVLASKKIADELRKFVKERERNAGTTLCDFLKRRVRDFFWLEETRPNNEDDGGESGAVTGDIPAVIELTEKPLKRKKIKVKRVAANRSTTTDTEHVAKEKDDGTASGGSTETLPPLPIGNSSSDDE